MMIEDDSHGDNCSENSKVYGSRSISQMQNDGAGIFTYKTELFSG